MSEFDYDLLTIGAGSGGVRASRMAATHGAEAPIDLAAGDFLTVRALRDAVLYSAPGEPDPARDRWTVRWTDQRTTGLRSARARMSSATVSASSSGL